VQEGFRAFGLSPFVVERRYFDAIVPARSLFDLA
jgi:hypothetical protein